MKRKIRRLLALVLCLGLTFGLFGTAAAAEDDVYLRPIAGTVVQVAIGADHVAVLRSDGVVEGAAEKEESTVG